MNFSTWTAKLNKLKHMKGQDWLIVILLGVLVLIVAIPSGALHSSDKSNTSTKDSANSFLGDNQSDSDGSNSDSQSGQTVEEDYVDKLEEELKTILEKTEGVGKVEVMITLKDEGEFFLDKDVSSEKESYKENSVIYNNGNNTSPYVTKENMPQIEGVLVVAEGGNNAETVTRISDSVVALFHVEVHKVKVIPMKENKKN